MGKIIKNGRVYAGGFVIDSELDTTSENPVQNRAVSEAINELNSDLSNKQDKPTTGVITLSATDCVPTAVGQSVYYHNDLLVGAKKVCVFCESISSDFSATIDTLDGFVDYNSAVIDNTAVQAEGTPWANNYWNVKLLIAFRRSWGGIYLEPIFKGDSQTFSNLRVTKIYYEK